MRLGMLKINRKFFLCFTIVILSYTNPIFSQTVTFESICSKAIEQSFQIKSLEKSIEISQLEYWQSHIGFLPKILLRGNSEHFQILRDQDQSFFSSLIGDETKFQQTISAELRYSITDFRTTFSKIGIAQIEIEQRKIESQKAKEEIQLELLEIYTNLLLAIKKQEILKEILSLQNQNLTMTARLRESSVISETELSQATIDTTRQMLAFEENALQIQSLLRKLSLRTLEKYSYQDDIFQPFLPDNSFQKLDPEIGQSYEYQLTDLELNQKASEQDQLRTSILPKIDLYGILTYYGKDTEALGRSIDDIHRKSWAMGINVSLPIEESIYKTFQYQKVSAEIQKLEYDKKAYEQKFQQNIAELEDQMNTVSKNIEISEKMVVQITEQEKMFEQLANQQLLIKTQMLKTKIEAQMEKMNLESARIKYGSTMYRLKIVSHFSAKHFGMHENKIDILRQT